jgi:hypothetical protein
MFCIRIRNFIFGAGGPMIQSGGAIRAPRRWTMDSREEPRGPLGRLANWLTECFERAQVRDHDRALADARNPREVSQRLHRIERGEDSFHP